MSGGGSGALDLDHGATPSRVTATIWGRGLTGRPVSDWLVNLNNEVLVSRLRKVWQKRKCSVKNGFLTICHGTVSPGGGAWPRWRGGGPNALVKSWLLPPCSGEPTSGQTQPADLSGEEEPRGEKEL